MHGRPNAVLNPGDVHINSAEVDRQVEKLDEVIAHICIGQEWDKDAREVLFAVLAEGVPLDEKLKGRVRCMIRSNASPRYMPDMLIAIPNVPTARAGKFGEIAVRETVHGRPVVDTQALANAECLGSLADHPKLRDRCCARSALT